MLSRKKKAASKGSSSTSVASGSSGSSELEAWVEVQARTFTEWINDKLKGKGHPVNHLFKDLEDGMVLISLLEVLSEKMVKGK